MSLHHVIDAFDVQCYHVYVTHSVDYSSGDEGK